MANRLISFRLSALRSGGTERVFLSVADYLSATYGWKVDFIVDKISGHETEHVALSKGYNVVGLDKSKSWQTILPFYKYLKNNRPDVVFSAYTETNASVLIANLLNFCNTSVIVTEHAPLDEHWVGRSRFRKMMLEFIVRYLYKVADRVVCVSRGMAVQLGKRLRHRHISYIHNPVRFTLRTLSKLDAKQALGIDSNSRVILAVGRICRQKNYLMLLEAFLDIRASGNLLLYIVGGVYEVDEKERVDRFIKVNNMSDVVYFVDFTHEIHVYYEAADLLVLSSAWEGFGNVLVEALAFGLPIVSSRCNYGPSEILADGEFGLLVDVNDSVSMGKDICRILAKNPFDSNKQVLRASEFSESRVGEAYHQLICETLN